MPKIDKEQPVEATGKEVPNKNSLVNTLAFIAAAAAIAIAGYSMHSNQQIQNNLVEDNKKLAAQLKQIQQDQTDTNKDLKSAQTSFQTTVDGLATLNQQVQTTLNQNHFKQDDWLLLKARYYIQLAQINAHWSSDYNSAIALLVQADEVLKQLNETKVFEIRQSLAKEMAQLKAIPNLDIAGVLSQLDAAQVSVDGLSIQSSSSENTEEKVTNNSTQVSGWRYHLQNSLDLLGKLVVIRRDNEEIKPLLSPLYEALLKENIRLDLQEAQWAVLNKNSAVYEMVLKQAIDNLKRTFNPNSQNTSALLNQLDQLRQIQLTQEQPEIGAALPIINQLIESKEVLSKPKSDKEPGDKQS